MLATSERVRPWSARCSPRSVGRVTSSSSPSCATLISRGMRSDSSPLGPLTRTSAGSMDTVTPLGTGMGFLPMRLTRRSPDLRHDLAADAGLARLVARHHAAGGGDDRRAHAALDLRDVAGVHVGAPAGPRDPAQAADHALALLGVAQGDGDLLARPAAVRRPGLIGGDVA